MTCSNYLPSQTMGKTQTIGSTVQFLLPANLVCEGNVFTPVMPGGRGAEGELAPQHALGRGGLASQGQGVCTGKGSLHSGGGGLHLGEGSASEGGLDRPPPPPEIHGILWDMVNERVACILLECILVIVCSDRQRTLKR